MRFTFRVIQSPVGAWIADAYLYDRVNTSDFHVGAGSGSSPSAAVEAAENAARAELEKLLGVYESTK